MFVAGADVKVSNLSTDQLADIFSGKISHWNQVGGHAARIRVLYREPTETSFGVIRRHLTPFQTLSFSEQAKLIYRDFEMLRMLDEFGAALGWLTHSSLVEASTPLKPLSLDNIDSAHCRKPGIGKIQAGAHLCSGFQGGASQ